MDSKKKSKIRLNREKVKRITDGVISKVVDLALISIYYNFEFALSGYGKGFQAEAKALSQLDKFDYESIKRSLSYLKRRGLINILKSELALPEITSQGRKRIKSIIPRYDSKRVWDKRLYLVTYDIPRKNNYSRNLLRAYLKRIGCGSLQQSVWISPCNPKNIIKEFVENNSLDHDLIIISSLGADGTIGETDLKILIDKVYKLSEVNERYEEFLVHADESGSKEKIVFAFLSILKDDPQLPFELLPDDWLGDEAYQLFLKTTRG